MSLPPALSRPPLNRLALPVIGSPLFIISNPDLVIAQCKAGIVGSFPALNARPASLLDEWLHRVTEELAAHDRAHPDRPAAPFAVNQIVHRSNDRLEADLAVCAKWKVPIVITSLGAREDVNSGVHSWGGITLHDVIDDRFARKAVEKGADGLIAVATGAGGHAGRLSPFALVQEIRSWFGGPLALAGAIATGDAILAAQAMGADFAYMGTAFMAAEESRTDPCHRDMLLSCSAQDLIVTRAFTGARANMLVPSILAQGLDLAEIAVSTAKMNFTGLEGAEVKPWKGIWSAGQGVGAIKAVEPAASIVARLAEEYRAASRSLVEGILQ